jgi:quercetin dioxygenase-like cupin family protein
MKVARLNEIPGVDARPGVVRQVFSGENATVAVTTLQPGHQQYPHSHPHEQIVYVMAGRKMRFVVGDEEAIVGAGDILVVPPGVEHYAENLGGDVVVDFSVFGPRRDDYAAEEAELASQASDASPGA